jgi:Flp pilus assembly protein TadD
MSVLYKALARASKARDALQDQPAPSPRLLAVGGRHTPRRRLRLLLLGMAGSAALMVGTLALFGDNLLSGLDAISGDNGGPPRAPVVPKVPPPGRPLPTPLPQVAAIAAPPPATISPPAAIPAAAPVVPPPPAPAAVSLAVPPASPPSAAPSPALAPAALAPAALAPAMPVVAAKPPVAPRPPAPLQNPPARAVSPAPAADEDLPAILDRIRRQKARPAIAEKVVVDRRTATADLSSTLGDTTVAVSASGPGEGQNARSAYDMLLHGQYEGALELYEKSLQTSPTNVTLLLGKATAQQKLRRAYDARQTYAQVLAQDPENREALTNMTAIVADQLPQRALQELRGLERTYPSFSPIAAQIAAIEARENNVPGAIAALNGAIALSPDNGLYRLNLAILQDRAGMTAEAAASYRTALDLLGSAASLPIPLEQIRQRLRYLTGS